MPKIEDHLGRRWDMEKEYKADQFAFEGTLERISNKALRTLQRSLKPCTGYFSVERERAEVIVESRFYFPKLAMLHLERCIRFRKITSWHCKLHLPHSPEAASKDPLKEKANQQSKEETATHEYHTKQLQKLQTILEKCRNLSSSGFICPRDDAFCKQNFPNRGLEKVYTLQSTYLEARAHRFLVKAAQRTANELWSRSNCPESVPAQMNICSVSQYACLPEEDA